MRYQAAFSALFVTLSLLLANIAQAQITVQDFEGPLPGPSAYPGGFSFSGGGNGSPALTEAIIDTDAVSGIQSYEVTVDATNNVGSYFYYGLGGFHGFYGEGFAFAEGQEGQNNPANYRMTFDLKVIGNNGDTEAATPVGGAVGIYKGDYEAVYDIDVNNDGDKDDGFDIWHSTFVAPVGDNDWNQIVWDLDSGTAPTTNGSPVPVPVFDDASNIYFQIYFNSGGFGVDADNVIRLDNVALEFVPPTATPGDFDGDGDVDGRDFLTWQRDPGVGSLLDWQNSYPTGGLTAGFVAVPEPASLLLALSAALFAGSRRRR